ncbi:MAG: tetratricopeptide repeat protein [Terracidiphilus sp.]
MKGILTTALGCAICLTATPLSRAQAPRQQPPTTSPANSNPFPEDTSSVPVMPTKNTPAASPDATYTRAPIAEAPQGGDDLDPVRSPDDPAPTTNSTDAGFSSSLAGLDRLLPRPDDDQSSKKRKLIVKEPTHQEASSKDIEVGTYYLQTKDWRGALSRFESALILDPENPDVYWGLAEANRHLGNLADARANYQKVAEYDPDSHHGKEAIKSLKSPEIANGKNPAPNPTAVTEAQQ